MGRTAGSRAQGAIRELGFDTKCKPRLLQGGLAAPLKGARTSPHTQPQLRHVQPPLVLPNQKKRRASLVINHLALFCINLAIPLILMTCHPDSCSVLHAASGTRHRPPQSECAFLSHTPTWQDAASHRAVGVAVTGRAAARAPC